MKVLFDPFYFVVVGRNPFCFIVVGMKPHDIVILILGQKN